MATPKEKTPHWKQQLTATEKMDAARRATKDTRDREVATAAIFARLWPSFIAQPPKDDALFPWLLCVETPAGRLSYRLSGSDMAGFSHVEKKPEGQRAAFGGTQTEKLGILLDLGVNGWK